MKQTPPVMKVLRALLLVLTLSVGASAGDMECGKTGNIPNDVAGEMNHGKAGNMPNEGARLVWQLLHSVLLLF